MLGVRMRGDAAQHAVEAFTLGGRFWMECGLVLDDRDLVLFVLVPGSDREVTCVGCLAALREYEGKS